MRRRTGSGGLDREEEWGRGLDQEDWVGRRK